MALNVAAPWQGESALREKGGRNFAPAIVVIVLGLAVALLPQALSIAALVGIVAAVVLLQKPTMAVYLMVFSVPYESVRSVSVGGFNAGSTEFIALFGGIAFLMDRFMARRLTFNWAWWTAPLFIFIGVMVLSMSQATSIVYSLKELLKLGEMVLTYLLVLSYIGTPVDGVEPCVKLRRLLYLVVIAACSQALLGVLQTVAHFGPASFLRGGVLRGSGTFGQPNPFAGYLNLTLPLLFAAVISGVPLVGRWTRPALALLALGILLSQSKGAMIATLLACAVILAVQVPRSRPLLFLAVVVIVAGGLGTLLGVVPSGLSNALLANLGLGGVDPYNPTPQDWPSAERLAHIIAGLNMFFDHPFLGVGIGNYQVVYPSYDINSQVWTNPLGHAHDYYVNVSAEAGIVGLAAFLMLLISAFVIAAHLYRRAADPLARALALGALGVLVTVAVHSLVDNLFVHAMETQLALVVGLATVAGWLSVHGSPQEAY